MADSPTGTVTFLFTDIEGSTRMWEQDPQAMSDALSRHDETLQNAKESRGGHIFASAPMPRVGGSGLARHVLVQGERP
jgi:class 3 adenylate cyclase